MRVYLRGEAGVVRAQVLGPNPSTFATPPVEHLEAKPPNVVSAARELLPAPPVHP